jgi:hypothetical protein
MDYSNSFDALGANQANFIDPLGLRLFGHPYNFLTGAQAHLWFSGWIRESPWGQAQQKIGRTILVNRSLGTAISRAQKGSGLKSWHSAAGLIKRAFRPDALSIGENGQGGELLELKPETYRGKASRLEATVMKVAGEVAYLAAHGIHVQPGQLIRTMPEAAGGVPIKGVVMDFDDSYYTVQIVAPAEGEAPGVVFYRLVGGGERDPARVPGWVRVLAPKLRGLEAVESRTADVVRIVIATGMIASEASKYILPALEEFGLAATEGAAMVMVPVVILPPCFLEPGMPCMEDGTIPGA